MSRDLNLKPGSIARGSDSKASAYNVGDLGSVPGSGKSPGEGNVSAAALEMEEPGRLRPWGRKESGTTERLHFHFLSPLPTDSVTLGNLLKLSVSYW